MNVDIMSSMFIYGEDGLTLKYTKERLGEILQKLGDNSKSADCKVFFRPSFGRGSTGYGEFDAIIISQEKAYLVEAKWDGGRDLSGPRKQGPIKLKKNQTRRHRIFEWFSHNWNGEVGEAWDRFAEKNNPDFKRIFKFKTSKGIETSKYIPSADRLLSQNIQTMFQEIGNRTLKDVLLIFYKDKPPEVKQEGFSIVNVPYNPTLGLFTELE